MSGASWQWSSADSGSGTFTDISGAATDAYTTVAADIGKYLKATVSYTDGHGSGKSAEATTGDAVSRRLPGSEFDTLDGAGNNDPRGVWSNGMTMWVADFSDDELFAYEMSDMSRDSSEDFRPAQQTIQLPQRHLVGRDDDVGDRLRRRQVATPTRCPTSRATPARTSTRSNDAGQRQPSRPLVGRHDDVGGGQLEDKEIYAYKMSDKSRDSGKDFDTLDDAGQRLPSGHLVGRHDDVGDRTRTTIKVYAYKMSDESRDSEQGFRPAFGEHGTLWPMVLRRQDDVCGGQRDEDKLFAYYVSDLTVNTALSGIEVNGTSIPGFLSGRH